MLLLLFFICFSALKELYAKPDISTSFTINSIVKEQKFPKEIVQKAVYDIFNRGHVYLLHASYGNDERTLNDVLQESENQWIRQSLMDLQPQEISSSYDDAKVELCKLEILSFILENISRSPKSFAGYTQVISKGFGQLDLMNPTIHFIANEGYPSIGDDDKKGLPCRFIPHCANLGVVKGPNDSCLITRSGKANSKSRMLECVVHACIEQMRSSTPTGLVERSDGILEFQHVITSYINTYFVGEKDCSIDLMNIIQSIDEWPQDGFLTVVDGKKVILQKPIFQNHMFSTILDSVGTAESETGQDRTDMITFVGNQQLLERFINKENVEISENLREASRELNSLLVSIEIGKEMNYLGSNDLIDWKKVPIQDLYLKRSQFFRDTALEEYQTAVASLLLQEKRRGIFPKALFGLMFRREMSENVKGLELHASDVDMFRNIVCQQLNLSQGKQCARGLDRTGIGVALAVAQDRYLQDIGEIFFPPSGVIEKGSEEHNNVIQFKRFFRESLKHFALPIGVESRGLSGVTSVKDENPVTKKYLFSTEDVGHGRPIVGVDEVDVCELSYSDLAQYGKLQYGGQLTERFIYSIPGQHIKTIDSMVVDATKNVTTSIHQHVESEILKILEETGLQLESSNHLLTSSLDLNIPVIDLKLHDTIGSETRLFALEKQLKTIDFSKEKHGLYVRAALLSIVNLGL
jgi:hypothetical protein